MCGIVGYIGKESAQNIVINGLKKLEYRGYDSSGIVFVDNGFETVKSVGRIASLEEKVSNDTSCVAFAHTRWATHGAVNLDNCHPHVSENNRVALVHNGVIENYLEMREEISSKSLKGSTDSEIIANYLESKLESGLDIDQAIQQFMEYAHGSYSLVIAVDGNDDKLYFVRNKTPLLVGVGNGFNIVASDALAVYDVTKEVMEIDDLEYGVVTTSGVAIYDKTGKELKRDSYTIDIDASNVEKGIHEHYMLKEIYDQPAVIREILSQYFVDGEVKVDSEIVKAVNEASELHIIAAGTSYYSGMVSKSILEQFTSKPTQVHIASEFAYDMPLFSKDALFIFISQSGETADLRAALVELKNMNMKTLTITNTKGSTLDREADMTLLLYAGREIAVASTKAFVSQLAVLAVLACSVSDNKFDLYGELSRAAIIIEEIFEMKNKIAQVSKESIISQTSCFFIGRSRDAKLTLEGALKLKEISYIHAEGFPAGELKHGTIALISEGTPVIGLITQGGVDLNTRSSLMEVEARGAKNITIAMEKYAIESDDFVFGNLSDEIAPIAAVVILQLISYYTALYLECDIDMPRNLAKSVTVE